MSLVELRRKDSRKDGRGDGKNAPPHAARRFLPTTRADMDARGWTELDVLLITGDAYVDHPAFGVSLVGRFLEARGYRVGMIAQPRWDDVTDIARMPTPVFSLETMRQLANDAGGQYAQMLTSLARSAARSRTASLRRFPAASWNVRSRLASWSVLRKRRWS